MAVLLTSKFLASSWTTRLATATGALAAVALSPAAGKAAVIKVTGSPVSLSPTAGNGATSFWDVDSDGSNDFRLFNFYYGLFFGSDGSNGRGLIAPFFTDNVQALNTSFNVGPTLASNVWGQGSNAGFTFRNMMSNEGNIGYDWNSGFGQGDNFLASAFRKLAACITGLR